MIGLGAAGGRRGSVLSTKESDLEAPKREKLERTEPTTVGRTDRQKNANGESYGTAAASVIDLSARRCPSVCRLSERTKRPIKQNRGPAAAERDGHHKKEDESEPGQCGVRLGGMR